MAREIARASGMDFRFEDICDWNLRRHLVEVWGMNEEVADAALSLYREPSFYEKLEPYRAAQIAALLLTALGYDLMMRSARQMSCEQVTKQWAGKYFPMIPDSRVQVFGGDEKIAAIVGSGAILHIDDHDGTVQAVNALGPTRAMMLIRPWNRTGLVPPKNELRNGWLSFLQLALAYRMGLGVS